MKNYPKTVGHHSTVSSLVERDKRRCAQHLIEPEMSTRTLYYGRPA